jgi:hypothetical protein
MKSNKLVIALLGFGVLAQNGMIAVATEARNPVDLTPTSLQQSGAEYDMNVATHPMKTNPTHPTHTAPTVQNTQTATTADRTVTRDISSNSSTTQEMTERGSLFPNQQAQMEHTSNHWFGAFVGLVVIGSLMFYALKRERNSHLDT